MADLPSRKDLFAIARRAIVTTPNCRINPTVVDLPGSDINILVGAMSIMGEEIVAQLAAGQRANFVEAATGDALDRVAFDRYGITRFPATPARVDLTLSRTVAGVAGTVISGTRVQTSDGVQFATDVDVVFGLADLTKAVTGTALVTGVTGNASAASVTQFVDAPFDPNLKCTNAVGAAGGAEAEQDPQFRGRLRAFFSTLRRGTLGAIEYGALQVPGVAVATAYELLDAFRVPTAMVTLAIADASGGSTPALVQAVSDQLAEYRACGIPVQVQGGVVDSTTQVSWSVGIESGRDQAQVFEQLRAVTVAVAQYLAPGETLFRASILAAARTIPGLFLYANSLQLPLADVVPASTNTLLRILDSNVTIAAI